MWEIPEIHGSHLSHDMPCQRCGHAFHTFLSCGNTCDCQPDAMPGETYRLSA